MSYEPTQWKDGDLVTSAKLNKIEQGIAAGGGILIVHQIDNGEDAPTLDKTWQEIHDADVCYIIQRDNEYSDCKLVRGTSIDDGEYLVGVFAFTSFPQTFVAASSSDYPVLDTNSIIDPGNAPITE